MAAAIVEVVVVLAHRLEQVSFEAARVLPATATAKADPHRLRPPTAAGREPGAGVAGAGRGEELGGVLDEALGDEDGDVDLVAELVVRNGGQEEDGREAHCQGLHVHLGGRHVGGHVLQEGEHFPEDGRLARPDGLHH